MKQDFKKKRFDFHIWDLAGAKQLRSLWQYFYSNMTVDVLLYVVNANERGRFKESRAELQRIIHEEEFRDALKLVILNVHRPEDSNRVGASEARKILGVTNLSYFQPAIKVVEINAYTGKGFETIKKQICRYYSAH